MAPTLDSRLSHRDAPDRAFMMHQVWEQLLFLPWRTDPVAIQQTLPPGLTVDTFKGEAWLTVAPFFMRAARMRFLPRIPWLGSFLETNVRTYVYDSKGRAGIWFYSLDCNQPLAVLAAKVILGLPYRHAAIRALRAVGGGVDYTVESNGHSSRFLYQLGFNGAPAGPESLDFFLIERYFLFTKLASHLAYIQVNHDPYSIVSSIVEARDSNLLRLDGLGSYSETPDHVTGCPYLEVKVYPPAIV